MNPNLCTVCETMFTRVMKVAQVRAPLTILFADVRGYTTLSTKAETLEVSRVIGDFYGVCGEIVWKYDGIVNKLIGDAVLAVFNFPLKRDDHVARALDAAIELQARCRDLRLSMQLEDGMSVEVGVGVGLHSGETLIGEVGQTYRDFTVIGPVVNLASRLQGSARPGEIVMTEAVYRANANRLSTAQREVLEVKGIEEPVTAYRLDTLSLEGASR
jgi:class 3 adenylate cyclase